MKCTTYLESYLFLFFSSAIVIFIHTGDFIVNLISLGDGSVCVYHVTLTSQMLRRTEIFNFGLEVKVNFFSLLQNIVSGVDCAMKKNEEIQKLPLFLHSYQEQFLLSNITMQI